MNKLIKNMFCCNILILALISSSAFAGEGERSIIFLNKSACGAFVDGNSEKCGADKNCKGMVLCKLGKFKEGQKFCTDRDCKMFCANDKSVITDDNCSKDLSAIVFSRARWCTPKTESNCRTIVSKDSSNCGDFSGEKSVERDVLDLKKALVGAARVIDGYDKKIADPQYVQDYKAKGSEFAEKSYSQRQQVK